MKPLISQLSILNTKPKTSQAVEKLLSAELIDRVSGGQEPTCHYHQTASDPTYDQKCD